jgi:biotin carboxyl carrier protein
VKLVITVDGVQGRLELGGEGDRRRFTYTANGAEINGEASLIEVEPGIYSVLWNGRSFEAKVAFDKGRGFVDVGGRHYAVSAEDPRELSRASPSMSSRREDIVAPMPGKVVRVLVSEGAEVEAGQGIAVIEAMKMQNEMPAPKRGRVVALRAKQGATVGAGELLATIE